MMVLKRAFAACCCWNCDFFHHLHISFVILLPIFLIHSFSFRHRQRVSIVASMSVSTILFSYFQSKWLVIVTFSHVSFRLCSQLSFVDTAMELAEYSDFATSYTLPHPFSSRFIHRTTLGYFHFKLRMRTFEITFWN